MDQYDNKLAHMIVIVVDRLGAAWLGPYGNSWIPTPELNRFAARSVLWEFVQADSCHLDQVYRSYFTGFPALCSVPPVQTIAQLAQNAGYATQLLTDVESLARHEICEPFQQVEWTNPPTVSRAAQEVKETLFADFFSYAETKIRKLKEPSLVWLHCGALNAAWDAPYELRESLAAEDDPPPPHFVAPPELELASQHDPDQLLGYIQAYAAQVSLLDRCLGSFLATVDAVCDPSRTLVAFTSSRGFPLGEHLQVGASGDALRGEVLQVPLLLRLPGDRQRLNLDALAAQTGEPEALTPGVPGANASSSLLRHNREVIFRTLLTRHHELQHSSGLFHLLHEQMVPSVLSANYFGPNFVVSYAEQEIAIRTPAWFFRQTGSGEQANVQLYVKPDDRWETNEVSNRASEIVAGFERLAAWLELQRYLPKLPPLPELPPELFHFRH